MKLLRRGSRGPRVELLQRLINEEYGGTVLGEDGVFGPKTREEVVAFQSGKGLNTDGVVGPLTWRAMNLIIDIEHPVTLVAQPTGASCWAAAASMVFGNMSVTSGSASTIGGGLPATDQHVRAFARSHGLTMHAPMTRSVQGFANLARRGPLWIAGRQPLGTPTGRSSTHAVVVGAMWGNGTADGTMLLVFDPWPPGVGSTYGVFYGGRLANSPMMTTFILHR